jgi:hypothetical protein
MEMIDFKEYEFQYSETSTKDLLITLNIVRADLTALSQYEHDDINDDEVKFKLTKIYDALKAELATREHVPNKKECKKARQEKFKLKKT